MKLLYIIILSICSTNSIGKGEIYKEFSNCVNKNICDTLKLFDNGIFKYKLTQNSLVFEDKGNWLILRNRLILKSFQKTKISQKQRKKYFFKNEKLVYSQGNMEFKKAKDVLSIKHSKILKRRKNKEIFQQNLRSEKIYASYSMSDFKVFSTLTLFSNNKFKFEEFTHSWQTSEDFGNWKIIDGNFLLLNSANNSKGIFRKVYFSIENNEISLRKKSRYEGFYSKLVKEE